MNQSCDIQAFGDSKLERRNTYKTKKNNKKNASARRALTRSKIEIRDAESKAHINNPNNVPGRLKIQSGLLPNGVTAYLPAIAGIDTNRIVSEIENITALYMALRESQSATQAASILFLYFKGYCSGSVLTQIVDFIRTECNFDLLSPQSGDDVEEPSWLGMLRDVKTNWSVIVRHKAFSKLSTIISMSAALGLCKLSTFTFDINGVRVFALPAFKRHVSAVDLIEAVVDTASYFIEGGYKCFVEGSLSPFIYSDDEAVALETEYFELLDLAPFMKAGNLESKKGVTENDYDHKLNSLIDRFDAVYKASEGTFEKKILFDRLAQLRRIRADFIAVRVDGKLRQAPFAIYIEGPSGVGKSSVSALLMRIVLMKNGFDASDERLTTINEADKYMSTYRSHINGIFVDDLGNTRAEFVEKSPVEKVIEIVNNVPAYANMAEADLKGKVSIQPHCLVGTSNSELCILAGKYSTEAYSIVRRFPLQLYVKVKKEFAMEDGRLDSNKVHEKYPEGIPAIPDLWDIDVFEPYDDKDNQFRRQKGNAPYSIKEVIDYAVALSKRHFRNQSDVVEYASNLDERLRLAMQEEEKLDTQMREVIQAKVAQVKQMVRELDSPWLRWTNYVPASAFDNKYFDAFLTFLRRRHLWVETEEPRNAWKGSLLLGLVTLMWSWFLPFFIIGSSSYLYGRTLIRRKQELIRSLRDMNGAMPVLFKKIRDNHVLTVAGVGTLLGCVYLAIRAWRSARNLGLQGKLNPTSMEDIRARDAEANPWAGVQISPLVATQQNATATPDQVTASVERNLTYMVVKHGDKSRYCDALFLRTGIAVIPNHILEGDDAYTHFYRTGRRANGAVIKTFISRKTAVRIPDSDLLMVWVPGSPDFKDITCHLVHQPVKRQIPCTMIWKNEQMETETYHALLKPDTVTTSIGSYLGYRYLLDKPTKDGLCMGTWLYTANATQIVGFHLGGKGNHGGAGFFSKAHYNAALEQLRQMEGILIPVAEGSVPSSLYGENFFEGPHVHKKSPVNFLPEDNALKIYGSCAGRSSVKSEVTETIISPHVEAVCGVPQKWGPPQFDSPNPETGAPQRWKPWQASLEQSSCPSPGMEGTLLVKASADYKAPIVRIVQDNPEIAREIKPLTDMENVCGIDGRRFIDKLKPNTAVGYPLTGPKSKYLTLLDPALYDGVSFPVELDQRFWAELARMEELWLDGERAYPIFKASLKDEPTKLGKEKVRVFQAAPIALQLAVRKYFLPLARLLSLFPLVSECAVGINAQGPEWDELARHVKQHGDDRILAGDYSKYDLRMPAQLIMAAFRILIDVARATGNYSPRDIKIMEGIATEIAYPVMAYNGDLLQHIGSNPSGQNLTVYINSVVNSLLFRCGFFDIYKNRDLSGVTFRQVVSLITYGDDAKSSVKAGWDDFNHISLAEFLSARDMKFTMPDKESEPTKYMTDIDADLLKRKNVYNPDTGLIMGALDESSIFKSLHSVLRSKAVSNEEQCMCNIDGALREWFSHGRDVYEKRRAEMQEVAARAGIAHGCSELSVDYDMALTRYASKYNLELANQSGVLLDPQAGDVLTEEEQFAELQQIFDLKMTDTNCVISAGGAVLGEIDAVFHACHDGQSVYVLVECKYLNTSRLTEKAREQIVRYCKVFALLQPKACIIGYSYCGHTLRKCYQRNDTNHKIFQ